MKVILQMSSLVFIRKQILEDQTGIRFLNKLLQSIKGKSTGNFKSFWKGSIAILLYVRYIRLMRSIFARFFVVVSPGLISRRSTVCRFIVVRYSENIHDEEMFCEVINIYIFMKLINFVNNKNRRISMRFLVWCLLFWPNLAKIAKFAKFNLVNS